VHTLSSVDMDLGTLSHVHRDPKPITGWKTNQSSQDVLLLHMCQYLLLFQFLNHNSENTSVLSFNDSITDSYTISNDDLHIALRKGKHLHISS